MQAFRIADSRHTIFSGTGAMLVGGRWNSIGKAVIYAAETYSGALLEVLVHANLSTPPRHHKLVTIDIPDTLPIETLPMDSIADWHSDNLTATRDYGDRWLTQARTAVLRVPGVVTRGREANLLLNPAHLLFSQITASVPEPIDWDPRLFLRD